MSIKTLQIEAKTSIENMVAKMLQFFAEEDPTDPTSEDKAKQYSIDSIREMGKLLYDIAAVLETCSSDDADLLLNRIELQDAMVSLWNVKGKLASGKSNENEND